MPFKRRLTALAVVVAIISLCLLALGSQGAVVSGLVFQDKRLDGMYQDGEDLLSGVEVTLVREDAGMEQPIATYTTDHTGQYRFDGLPAGDYFLRFMLPGGFVPTRYLDKGSLAIPSNTRESRTAPFTLTGAGETQVLIGAMPTMQTSFVRAIAFGDDNLNGGRFSSEPLLRDVEMELLFELDGVHYLVGTARTNKEGIGTIANVAPGTYVLGATMPGNYIIGPLGEKISLFYNAINPAEGHYGRSSAFVLPMQGSIGMGIGGAVTGMAMGAAWEDLNFDGLRDSDEPGAQGVIIRMRHLSMGVEREAITDEIGAFNFPTLQPGTYEFSATVPQGSMFTISGGDSALSSDTELTAARQVSIAADTQTQLGNVGIMPITQLTLRAFHDSNLNGIQDAGEPPFAGAVFEAFSGDTLLSRAITDAGGHALLPLLRAGDINLRTSLPDGQVFSVAGGDNGNAFYSPTAENALTIPYALTPAMHSVVYAGLTLPAQIAGRVFEDTNSNALWDMGEPYLPGFTAQAYDSAGRLVGEAQTDDQGRYLLATLVPGTYDVHILLQSPYIFSGAPVRMGDLANRFTEQTAHYGVASDVSVAPGGVDEHVDGAVFRSGVILGRVLLGDEQDNFSGKQGGLADVAIELLDEDGLSVSQYTVAITDENGGFLLKGALPGTYSLRYTLPRDAAFSRPATDEQSVTSAPFVIQAADEQDHEALYAVKTGTVSGVVYLDENVSGTQDAGDPPIKGALIEFISSVPANSRSAQSTDDGAYAVTSLRPGDYRMQVSLPQGKLISFDMNSPLSPATGSRNSVDFSIGMGEVLQGRQVAALNPHTVQGRLYFDDDLSGAYSQGEQGVAGLMLKWRHMLTKVEYTADTDESGNYYVPLLFPGDYALSVTLPADHELYAPQGAVKTGSTYELGINLPASGDATVQNIGLVQFGSLSGQIWNMDGSMADVSGLHLALHSVQGKQVAQAETDRSGAYHFERLYPGEYKVHAALPEGFRFAREVDSLNTRYSLITSDGPALSEQEGMSQPFRLQMAAHLTGQDIGMGVPGKLGDYAWLDLDGDGMQDAGEPGVPGIEIRLYQYDQVVAQAATDAYGRYLIDGLYPGSYRLEVTMPAELTTTLQQQVFPLVASILPHMPGTTAIAQGVVVPSGGRNLNADLGFMLLSEGKLPPTLQQLPQRDWTPLVPTVPKRTR